MYDPNGFYEDDDDVEYTHFKEFKKNGKLFDKKYPARAHQNLLQSFSISSSIQFLKFSRETKKMLSRKTWRSILVGAATSNVIQETSANL